MDLLNAISFFYCFYYLLIEGQLKVNEKIGKRGGGGGVSQLKIQAGGWEICKWKELKNFVMFWGVGFFFLE